MRFGGLTAVQGVDIHLAAGEVLGIIGPNGAGKSTLLNLLTGIYQPTEGEVLLQGRSLKGMAAHDIAGAGIARTFQTSRLFGSLSVLDNVIAGVKNGATDAGAMQQALGRGLNELDAGMSRVQAMRSFAGDQLNRADRLVDDMKN
ncbi:ATP-binding cassette domain-containing protein, partial [Acinetobacter baumannii]|nr:ATP-binding cassette domain-containing protein [Acinetobacter baumannii]MCW1766112.1 ATP-binding cassette domain-containing protein [Acinetobacter baumannii]